MVHGEADGAHCDADHALFVVEEPDGLHIQGEGEGPVLDQGTQAQVQAQRGTRPVLEGQLQVTVAGPHCRSALCTASTDAMYMGGDGRGNLSQVSTQISAQVSAQVSKESKPEGGAWPQLAGGALRVRRTFFSTRK